MGWFHARRGGATHFTLPVIRALIEEGPACGPLGASILRRHPLRVYVVTAEDEEQRYQDAHEDDGGNDDAGNGPLAEPTVAAVR